MKTGVPPGLHPMIIPAILLGTLWIACAGAVWHSQGMLEARRDEQRRIDVEARRLEEEIEALGAELPALMRARPLHEALARRSARVGEDAWGRKLEDISTRLGLQSASIQISAGIPPEGVSKLRFRHLAMELQLVNELDLLAALAFLAKDGPGILQEQACRIEAPGGPSERLPARCELTAVMLPARDDDGSMP